MWARLGGKRGECLLLALRLPLLVEGEGGRGVLVHGELRAGVGDRLGRLLCDAVAAAELLLERVEAGLEHLPLPLILVRKLQALLELRHLRALRLGGGVGDAGSGVLARWASDRRAGTGRAAKSVTIDRGRKGQGPRAHRRLAHTVLGDCTRPTNR